MPSSRFSSPSTWPPNSKPPGVPVTLELLEGAGHADPAFETPENVARVLDFLDGCRKTVAQ